MEEWEKRYLHEKDVMECQCISIGITPPIQKKYGTLTNFPKQMWRAFKGKAFWELFSKRNHTSMVYEQCSCSRK